MANVKFTRGTDAKLGNIAKEDGQILYSTDKNILYIDTQNGDEIDRKDIVPVKGVVDGNNIKISDDGLLWHKPLLSDIPEQRLYGPMKLSENNTMEADISNSRSYNEDATIVDPATLSGSEYVTVRIPYFRADQQGHIVTNNETAGNKGNHVALRVYPNPNIQKVTSPLTVSNNTLSLGTVPVNKGGTGSTSATAARTALGITPANIGAAAASHTHDNYLPLSGGTLTNDLCLKDSNYAIGDTHDENVNHGTAIWMKDKNDETLGAIQGHFNADGGHDFIVYGMAKPNATTTNFNSIYLGFQANHTTPNVYVSAPAAWRNALKLDDNYIHQGKNAITSHVTLSSSKITSGTVADSQVFTSGLNLSDSTGNERGLVRLWYAKTGEEFLDLRYVRPNANANYLCLGVDSSGNNIVKTNAADAWWTALTTSSISGNSDNTSSGQWHYIKYPNGQVEQWYQEYRTTYAFNNQNQMVDGWYYILKNLSLPVPLNNNKRMYGTGMFVSSGHVYNTLNNGLTNSGSGTSTTTVLQLSIQTPTSHTSGKAAIYGYVYGIALNI